MENPTANLSVLSAWAAHMATTPPKDGPLCSSKHSLDWASISVAHVMRAWTSPAAVLRSGSRATTSARVQVSASNQSSQATHHVLECFLGCRRNRRQFLKMNRWAGQERTRKEKRGLIKWRFGLARAATALFCPSIQLITGHMTVCALGLSKE
ncbi:MAG TPA: hypothetical protein DDZ51_26480 [Planctomycetaceae bacterium]|nr:hypothetical protein [Planctomycetaceae bacterium]